MKHISQQYSGFLITQYLANLLRLLTILMLGTVFTMNGAYAASASDIAKKKQTKLALYFTPAEAYEHMQKHGNKSLFIDVRDPVEVNFTGMPTVADANVPFKFANTSKWHPKKKQFGMKKK